MSDFWNPNRAEIDRDITRADDPEDENDAPVTAQSDPAPDIYGMIRQYEEARVAYDLAMADMERARAEVLAQVQDQLDAIAEEFGPMLAGVSESIEAMTTTIKNAVARSGETHKGRRAEFRYAAGRRTVKVAGVDKLIKRETDPARRALLENLIEQGDPVVSIYYK